jgi:hypothetical protein
MAIVTKHTDSLHLIVIRPLSELNVGLANCDELVHEKGHGYSPEQWRSPFWPSDPVRRAADPGSARLYGMRDVLPEHRDWLRMFLEVDGVERTKIARERALRSTAI